MTSTRAMPLAGLRSAAVPRSVFHDAALPARFLGFAIFEVGGHAAGAERAVGAEAGAGGAGRHEAEVVEDAGLELGQASRVTPTGTAPAASGAAAVVAP